MMKAKMALQRSRATVHTTMLAHARHELDTVREAIIDASSIGRTNANVLFYASSKQTVDVVAAYLRDQGYMVSTRAGGPVSIFINWLPETPKVSKS